MLERLKKLLNSVAVQRAISSSFGDPDEIVRLVELRVVREFNLPDDYSSVLRVRLNFINLNLTCNLQLCSFSIVENAP